MRLSMMFILVLSSIASTISYSYANQKTSNIIIDFSLAGKVNPLVFGHNSLGHDSCTFSKDTACTNNGSYSNMGSGQWDPQTELPRKDFLQISKNIDLEFLRFPGGCGTHQYNWKKTIGPLALRPLYQFGIDEFLTLCEKLNIEPIITLSYFTGSNQDLVDLVEYLNVPLHSGNPNGGKDWAGIRAQNGHPAPYGVKYFELGNEVYHGNHVDIGPPAPDEYARRYIDCRREMKKVDVKVQLGAVLQGWSLGMTGWDKEIVPILASDMDFAIVHVYPISYRSDSGRESSELIFGVALASSLQAEYNIETLSRQLGELTKRDIPLAITEYNGGFVQSMPTPYRHSLGNALLIADLLRVFLTVDAPILGANYWQLVNSFWGLMYNDLYREKKGNYTRRPNYFVFELYSQHFGDFLLKTDVTGPAYASKALGGVLATSQKNNDISTIPNTDPLKIAINPGDWETNSVKQILSFFNPVQTSIESNGFCLSFSEDQDIDYTHTEFKQSINPERRYRLSGKIKTEKLMSVSGVSLSVRDRRGWRKTGWEKSTQKISGTNDWKNVLVEFQPMDGADNIVIAISCRYCGGKHRGTVWVKDVILEDIGPAVNFPPTPYLSVVSSSNDSKDKINIIVINKNLKESMPAQITIKNGFEIDENGKSWVLNGTAIESTNENMKENVQVTEGDFTIKNHDNSFRYVFSPHSVTALELHKKILP